MLASVVLARGAIGPDVYAAILAAVAISIIGVDDPGPAGLVAPPAPALAVADQ